MAESSGVVTACPTVGSSAMGGSSLTIGGLCGASLSHTPEFLFDRGRDDKRGRRYSVASSGRSSIGASGMREDTLGGALTD